MKKTFTILILTLVTTFNMAQNITLPIPIEWNTQVSEISKPVVVRNENGRWMSTVGYDIRNQIVYDSVGTRNRMRRLTGELTIEISTPEVLVLRDLTPETTYLPGEWEEHVYQAGFIKAMILSQPSELRTQYETYWNQVVYSPVPVTMLAQDANGEDIIRWDNLVPIIGYSDYENLEGPVFGTLPQDGQGNNIFGFWNGLPVIGYDSLGFPLFAQE